MFVVQKINLYILLICCFLLPLNAWCEKLSREELLFLEIPVVVTASRFSQPTTDAPASVIVIDKEQIRERGYNNLLDLMKDLPNVDVHSNSGEEFYNAVIMRGYYGQEKFIIMRDGYRINSPTNERIPIEENFPLYNAKQVEVVYGPASALYGADAFTGIINIITKDATEIGSTDLSFSGGSFGYQNHYLNMGDRLSENVKLSAGGHWHNADNADLSKYYDEYEMNVPLSGYTSLPAGGREDYYGRTSSYSAYLKVNIDDRFSLGISESYFRHPTTTGNQPKNSIFGSSVKWETLIKNYYGEYKFESGRKLSGKTSLSYHTYEVLPSSKYKNSYVGFDDAYKYANSKKFMIEQQIDYKLDESTIVGGVSYENFYSLPKTYDLMGRKYDPDLPASEQQYYYGGTDDGRGEPIPVKIFELNYENYGAYLQAQTPWSKRFSSTLGIRYDYNSRYGKTVNPRGGVVIKPVPSTVIKVLYGEAYLSPSPYSAYAYHFGSFNNFTSGQYVVDGTNSMALPNHDLKPEKSRTTELAVQYDFHRNFTVDFNAYYTEVDEIIQTVSYTNMTSYYIEGAAIANWKQQENVGDAVFYGGHLSTSYKKDLDGVDLKFWGNYSYVDGWVKEYDSTLDRYIEKEHKYISKHKVKGGVTVAYGKYYITPIMRWIGEANSNWVGRTTSKKEKVRAYTVTDLNLGVRDIVKNTSVALNVTNLFDRRYYNAGTSGQSFEEMPQEPRRIVFSLNYSF